MGAVVGLTLVFVGMLQHRSENATVLGRWSTFFAASLCLVLAGCLLLLRRFVRRSSATGSVPEAVQATALDIAILLWGISYLASALDEHGEAGRLLAGNLFGSISPLAIVLNWFVMALLFVAGAATLSRMSRRRQNVALMSISAGTALLLGEGCVRARAAIAPTTQNFPTYTSRRWERHYAQLNSLGFRDAERMRSKGPGVRRLILVGDSYAFGYGINNPADRLGDMMGPALDTLTSQPWEVINASRPDTHTLQHTHMLTCMLAFRPDVVVLLYTFNDIDYLDRVNVRAGVSETPSSLLQRVSPVRIAYMNFFLYQEIYVKLRAAKRTRGQASNPYGDDLLLTRHVRDIGRFVDVARAAGAATVVVPFDVAVEADTSLRTRYNRFLAQARAAGLPVMSLGEAFAGHEFDALTVSSLDRHPNELANKLALSVLAPALSTLSHQQPPHASATSSTVESSDPGPCLRRRDGPP